MLIIRPAVSTDLSALMALATKTGVGFTSLPCDEQILSHRLARSADSFAGLLPKTESGFLFAMEDLDRQQVVGICGIESAIGLHDPWYNYRIGTIVHASAELGVWSRHETLFLSNDHTGLSELCTLFLDPDYRGSHHGAFLSKSRFLFMAEQRQAFAESVIAEMRGVSHPDGRSPFWEGLGRHFFSIDFAAADHLIGIGKKSFIAELMPKNPVYIDFLSAEAKAVIGDVHEKTRPALKMLQAEGLRFEGYIDIFDAGPTLRAAVGDIRAIRESRHCVAVVVAKPARMAGRQCLVSNLSMANFRVMCVDTPLSLPTVCELTPQEAEMLQVSAGDVIRCVSLDVDHE